MLKQTIKECMRNASKRLTILSACGFARTVEHLLTDQRSRYAIDISERFADGLTTLKKVKKAASAANTAASASAASYVAANAAYAAAYAAYAADAVFAAAYVVASADAATYAAADADAAASDKCNLILDCLNIKFVSTAKRYPVHVKGLADIIYQNRDWKLMPVLADALEEIDLTEMAKHCRESMHAKGCYVLDTILGKR